VDDELHAAIARRLRHIGQRYTAGRRSLVDAIVELNRPATAAELLASRRRLPQSTTYRGLAVLEQAGVVSRVRGADDSARFELSEELAGHHHHLVCVDCGNVEDFVAPPGFERNLAGMIGNVVARSGFRTAAHRLELLGTCDACSD
jgi:Fe2+ or Zn2+ uptake regulation protein